MTYKTRYAKTYRFVRALNLIWWMIAVFCIYKGGMALTSYQHTPEPLVATFWLASAFGLIIAIRRGNKKREQSLVKLAQQHRAG
jgi:hypothetical protein